jgi:hypothetical protein
LRVGHTLCSPLSSSSLSVAFNEIQRGPWCGSL